MPTFFTSTVGRQPIPDGTYVLKVLTAVEKISERGNEMLVMKLGLPDESRTIPCTITFVPAAKALVNAFVASCGLTPPPGEDVEAELRAEHVRGRQLYAVIANDISDPVSDPVPRIVRFISREAAILKDPSISNIQLLPQPAVVLSAVRTEGVDRAGGAR
jgi:hypothetical protein